MSLPTSAAVEVGRTKLGRTTYGNARDNQLITGTDDTLKQSNFYEEDCRKNATRKISWAQRASQAPQGRITEQELLTVGKLSASEATREAVRCKALDKTIPLKVLSSERKFNVCKFQTAVHVASTSQAVLWHTPEDLPTSAKSGKEISRRRAHAGHLVFDVGQGIDPMANRGDGRRSWDGRMEGQTASYCLLTLTDSGAYLMPVDQWYTFQPRVNSRLVSAEEAERSDEQYRDRVLSHAQRLIGRPQGEHSVDLAPKNPVDIRRKTVQEKVDVDDEVGDEEKLQFDDDSDGAVSDTSVDRMLAAAEEDEEEEENEENEEGEDEARREFRRQKKRRMLTEEGNAVQQLLKKQKQAVEAEAQEDDDLTEDEGAAPTPSSAMPSPFLEPEPAASAAAVSLPKPVPKKSRRKEPPTKAGAAPTMSLATAATTLEGQIRAFFHTNGNRKTPVKQLMKHLMKEDAKFQALKGNKDQKEAHFKRMVANTNKVIADIGHKEQQEGELLVWLR